MPPRAPGWTPCTARTRSAPRAAPRSSRAPTRTSTAPPPSTRASTTGGAPSRRPCRTAATAPPCSANGTRGMPRRTTRWASTSGGSTAARASTGPRDARPRRRRGPCGRDRAGLRHRHRHRHGAGLAGPHSRRAPGETVLPAAAPQGTAPRRDPAPAPRGAPPGRIDPRTGDAVRRPRGAQSRRAGRAHEHRRRPHRDGPEAAAAAAGRHRRRGHTPGVAGRHVLPLPGARGPQPPRPGA